MASGCLATFALGCVCCENGLRPIIVEGFLQARLVRVGVRPCQQVKQ